MILFDKEKQIFHLHTKGMSYVIGVKDNLQSLYWGAPVNVQDCVELLGNQFHSSFDPDTNLEREEYSCWNGRGFTETCLQIAGVKGDALFPIFSSYEILEEKDNVQILSIELNDNAHCTVLVLEYKVYEDYDIISRRAILKNEGERCEIENFQSGALNLPPIENGSLRYVTGKWAGEFQIVDAPINTGVFTMQSKRGITGPHFNPSFAISEEGTTEQNGDVWFGLLAYSGNWKMSVEKTIFNNIKVIGGINNSNFSWTLEKGQSITSPELIFGYSKGGFGEMSRKLHRFEGEKVTTTLKPRRVLYNSWEATAFDVNAEEQKRLADKAAMLGVELFVVDDGWFGERNSDTAGLGDWTTNKTKFPKGLEELVNYVNKLGMDFGIWVEPEGVNPDSDLYRAHPEWIYHFDGVEPMQSRNQYVLNISIPAVKQYLFEMLRGLLSENNISFIKWDMNRMITDCGTSGDVNNRELWKRHVDALYDIWRTLKEEFPHVELETCAGGGGRIDLGILKYADECWPSDNTDPYERLFIQEGFSNFYAPKIMMCWVTDTPENAGRAGRKSISYKFHSAMCGGLGIGSNINKLSQEELDQYKRHIEEYKEIRSVIQFGKLYRLLSPRTSNLTGIEYLAKAEDEVVVFAFLHSQKYGNPCPRLKLQGLSEDTCYEIVDSGKRYFGSSLMQIGLPLNLKGDFDSVMLRLRRV